MLFIRTSDDEDISFANGTITEFEVYSCEEHGGWAVHQNGRIVPHERGVDSMAMVKRERDAALLPSLPMKVEPDLKEPAQKTALKKRAKRKGR